MSSISGIAKSMLQVRAGMKTEDVSKEMEESMTVSFMELMNQNNFSGNVQVSSESDGMEIASVSSDDVKTAYDSTASAKKEVSVKKEVTATEKKDEAAEPLDAYEEEVREVLKKELGVTDEEIEQAMESLGLEFFDLVNTKNLTSLVQALTGENIGTLFLSDAFQNIMSEVSVLTDALCTELGMTKEELLVLCDEWKQMSVSAETKDAVTEDVLPESMPSEKNVPKTGIEQSAVVENETVEQNAEVAEETVKADNVHLEDVNVETTDVKADEMTIAETESFSQGSEQSFAGSSQNSGANAGFVAANQQSVQNGEFVVQQEVPQPYTQVDVASLIEQVAKNVRVHISSAMTSMEMQLNPEHLGKLYLQVSESEGVVRAQITAQTEVVKEALETQLVELRQTLNQQGVKVDAIEVTVATHEFEQNLEGNAKQEEQMQQQMEESQKQARRNINMNDLDGLTGLMSEEEALVAQIMKDNGNQVDLTA